MDLSSQVTLIPKVGPNLAYKLKKLGIATIEDLFYHAPTRYIDYSVVKPVSQIQIGETITIHGKVNSIKNVYSKRGLKMQIGSVEDETGKVGVLWFNQPFLIKSLYPGRLVSLSGKIDWFSGKPTLISPEYELLEGEETQTLHTGKLVAVYPETSGLSSKWIRRIVKLAISGSAIYDFLPKPILKKYKLIDFKKAVDYLHFPKSPKDADLGRKRLAFNELLFLNLKSLFRKSTWRGNKVANKLIVDTSETKKFVTSLPFQLTSSQSKVIDEILSDLVKDYPANRLLEGDVGSGKTVVAAIAAFVAFTNGYQTVFMAPTQILANQHYETLVKLFKNYKIRISLITSSIKKLETGRSDIFIGTHALTHKKINFDRVALVVIDEQHRFGVEQRAHLVKKAGTPHILTMTATPIPRTVALTTYGDLDVSVLTDMPLGRQKVTTWLIPSQKRQKAYDWIKSQIDKSKSQAFVVCPLIEESEKETMKDIKAVTTEFLKLKSVFSNLKLGLLHGKLKSKEKETVLDDFRSGKIDILVATPVVEVGIDIPNTTIMVIEGADRFGLAQLHQLRGRVGRSDKKAYCLLFGKPGRRLTAMTKIQSGFELAELDLKLRGPGEIFGTLQSGFPELTVASWTNYELIKESKGLAEEVLSHPQKFKLLLKNTKRYYEAG
jgi:ATP-dependent DNA helicase RecG